MTLEISKKSYLANRSLHLINRQMLFQVTLNAESIRYLLDRYSGMAQEYRC